MRKYGQARLSSLGVWTEELEHVRCDFFEHPRAKRFSVACFVVGEQGPRCLFLFKLDRKIMLFGIVPNLLLFGV